MSQFTITYRDQLGLKFAFIEAATKAEAERLVRARSEWAVILTVRENNPPLPVIVAIS